ncbi:pentapeptide repeat-containing protein [Nocardioides sp. L-11A]|uniref:pentapeptide repeat-containing protein n=1 Tax=Nocardioides sp. L-11A TaxID=3043848 RepID=UPI00249BB64B|nr:pentapeptide repeat-containing protein [Nocardioides sp. L-11A]
MADRRQGAPTPTTDSAVVSERWDGQDLSGRTFRRVAFLDVDLTDAVARGATFEECSFRGCDLSPVDPVATSLGDAVVDLDQAVALVRALGLRAEEAVPMEV